MALRCSAIVLDIPKGTEVDTGDHKDSWVAKMSNLVGQRINLLDMYGDLEWFECDEGRWMWWNFHRSWLKDFDSPVEE